ncbi:high-affinity branched-chain amino acid transporter permease [Salmonella enterica subsp. enterica]|uniref:High-affinity branched-chain amino acid transporter permease n=1 Tax=Salmonella enterica I TaxID=59201 RepID=A0A3S4LQR6_SALET|nr:high-affinity branched-chain amino acid transporter permease [Salmonella enterica subsp. enterica]
MVFFFQLLRPMFQKAGEARLRTEVYSAGDRMALTVKQKLFLMALLVIAVAWPFYGVAR